MLIGQKEKITFRGKVFGTSRSNFLSPTHGLGFGLGETGLVLNRVLDTEEGSTLRRVVREVTGVIVKETAEHVILKLRNGRQLKIWVSDIIRRKLN